ncbi:hypothetical protein SAMN05421678_101209 [Actinopolymorpha cephalotaxi]|uniref:Polyketide cyclase / dehydrase and lipid transport n=1 Tax=Actinopolymorpha cephalotaxi TaxID=504797 RepID=A0A1I2KEN7_9ACTN|nr:hypothetical protein [Actinopolymorpha cephalotaxi]NYH84440.1 hypothetical protein [Actinopolymorpha cephalotaxi]SFF64769.1 hypothetical protein SAMN05421678_101209 [Actinopolymorpha cephalotaxi]
MRLPQVWGARPEEMVAEYPCDEYFDGPTTAYFRAVTARADVPTVFRWLCQLKVAPYSYDLVDNRGRRSPRQLTPGAEHLEVGQRFVRIFTLAEFTYDQHLTLLLTDRAGRRAFGELAITYTVRPDPHASPGQDKTRLVAKLVLPPARHPAARLRQSLLGWGDLVMMRAELLNLAHLAERTARSRPLTGQARPGA